MIEASFPQRFAAQPAIKRISRKQAKAHRLPLPWPLLLILAMQTAVAYATLQNSAFQDEALYLYAGRQIFRYWMGGPVPLDRYAFYFSGYPSFYPVIGGVLDMIGGLELARAFSLLCMLGVNAVVYTSTQKLFQRPAAIFASATYASLGSVLFLSRLATYDALCLFLIALATSAAYRLSCSNRRPWLALVIGPLYVLSVLAKYAALLFALPALGVLIFCGVLFQGWRPMLLRFALVIVSLALSLVVTYHFMDPLAFHAIDGSTTNRVVTNQTPSLTLFVHVLQIAGIVYAVAIVGVVLIFLYARRFRLFALFLLGSSWLAPAYHIYKREPVSLDKHMAFSLFFAMPLAGYALAWLSGYMQQTISRSNGRYWLAGLSLVLLIFTLGTQQAEAGFAGWANTSALSYALHTQMRDGTGRFLVEDIEVARYDARDVTELWQWNGVNYFFYETADHQQLLGNPALQQAIKDRYFDLIELSFIYQPAQAYFIAQQMITTKNYDLIDKIFFRNSYGSDYFYLWRSAPVAGQGNFTSMSQIKV